ncbi:MAG: FHA domain-containing protein, partial [Candidatus Faecousia sp.]|nr:FHA domain-containing protein [Candidatus Faecousia sp.]
INELENEVVRIIITPFSIGRATESDYLIDKQSVSRKHAQIKLVDNYYLLEDLQSMNGTSVDGNLVKVGIGYRLKNGSIIQIEDNFFTFHVNPEYEESYETPH